MLSQTAQYAVRAFVCLAETPPEQHLTAAEIAQRTGLPVNYLSKILHVLAQNGLLESSRGPHGGFSLTRSWEKLTLADVLAPFGRVHTTECLLDHPDCSLRRSCPVSRRCRGLSRAIRAFVDSTLIADLVGTRRR